MIGGAILAILVGICIMGGGKQIVRITGVLVPFMGVFYIPDGSCGHVLKHRKTTGSVCQYLLQCL